LFPLIGNGGVKMLGLGIAKTLKALLLNNFFLRA